MVSEILLWLARALGGGVVGYLARRTLEWATSRFDELSAQPLEVTDQDLEELLSHLVEELDDLDIDALSFEDSLRVIKLRAEVSRAYFQMQLSRDVEEEKPGGV